MSDEYNLGRLKLKRRGPTYHISGTYDGKRIRRSTGARDIRQARAVLDDMYAESMTGWRAPSIDGEVSWGDVAKWVCARHRVTAKERGIPFDVTPSEIYKMMRATKFRCSVSGIGLTRKAGANAEPDPWSASLDRIERRHGYTRDNVRVVCLIANLAMNRWGYDALTRLSRAVVRSAISVASEENVTPFDTENGSIPNDIN